MTMQHIITALVRQHGLADAFSASQEFHLHIENPPYMPLVIERQGDEISVAHYSELNGDAIRDPEITFRWPDWTPTSITQDPVGRYAEVFLTENGRPMYRPKLLKELKSFAAMWGRNIKAQGFAQRGKATSLTHPIPSHAQLAPDAHLEMDFENRVSGGLDLD